MSMRSSGIHIAKDLLFVALVGSLKTYGSSELGTIMSDSFRVRFEKPVGGGLPITLTTNDHTLFFTVSHTPYDSLSDLITALIGIVLADTIHCSVRWNTEPVEYEFLFVTDTGTTTLTIIEWPDSTRQRDNSHAVFLLHGSRMEIVAPVWRALRQLESHGSETWEWQHLFPTSDMRKLDQHIRRVKQT
ncbi:MAG: hypothetical protein IPP13_02885 [Kouleothrix sp.]|jgi:hypothetical protein|nr:hypothetical protein [Kouleothrix sp.]